MFHKNDSTRRPQPRQFDTYDEFNERVRRAERQKVTEPSQLRTTHGFRRTEPDVRAIRHKEPSFVVWAFSILAFLGDESHHAVSYTTAPNERTARYAASDTAFRVFPESDGFEGHAVCLVRIDPMYFEI